MKPAIVANEPCLRTALELATGYRFSETAQFIGLVLGDEICAVSGFDNYSHHDCEVFVAVDKPSRFLRSFLVASFSYVFDQLGVRRCTSRVHSANQPAIKFNKQIGFVQEGILREAASDGSDVLVFGLLKGECKYHGPGWRRQERRSGCAEVSGRCENDRSDDECKPGGPKYTLCNKSIHQGSKRPMVADGEAIA